MKIPYASLAPFAVLVGAIVGVGIFGLPYVALHAGLLPLIGFFGLVVFLLFAISHAYGHIVVGTSGQSRLPGYVERYLGHQWKQVAFFSTTLGLWGALLTYIIVGGQFLSGLFQPFIGGSPLFFALLFFFVGALFVFRDAKTIARTELLLLGFFVLLIVIIVLIGIPHLHFSNLPIIKPSFILLPYGVALFALWGVNVLPDVAELVGKNQKRLDRLSLGALLGSTLIYVIFTLLVLGISRERTTPDALDGLRSLLGEKAMIFCYLFGLIATFTSFIALGLDLKKVFMLDYGFHFAPALLLTLGIPIGLYLAGIENFIGVISVVGGTVLGIQGILILKTYEHMARDRARLASNQGYRFLHVIKPLIVILAIGVILGLIAPYLLSQV